MKKPNPRVVLSKSGAAPLQIAVAGAPSAPTEPCENDIRAYAYHLYEQSDGAPGHDLEHWFEATACLNAGVPADRAGGRLRRHHGSPIEQTAETPLVAAAASQL